MPVRLPTGAENFPSPRDNFMTIVPGFPSDSGEMGDGTSPMRRFYLHALWVVLPFCLLAGLSWSAWRADAKTRTRRLLESAIQGADRALEETRKNLGPWEPIPEKDTLALPASSPVNPAAQADEAGARERYDAGDYEGVLGSPASVKSAAGLPLRSLAALQLLRKETSPARLGELVQVITDSPGFVSPLFLEEAERRFTELKVDPPESLARWREQWRQAGVKGELAEELRLGGGAIPAKWVENSGSSYLIERRPGQGTWRVNGEAAVKAAAVKAWSGESRWLADGLAITLGVGGRTLAGPADAFSFHNGERDGWTFQVVLADEDAYTRAELQTRNVITAVISMAGLAVILGLVLAGRSYARAVELARRQGEFMAAVSHEMRTPLAAMRLLAENLESGVADRAGQRAEHTRMIREECARLGDLVGNVLAFVRGGKGGPHEAFDVAAMVAEVAALVRPLAEKKGIDFKVTVEEFPEPPAGDAAALRRALLNLLDNSLKHTPEGGTVVCQAGLISGPGAGSTAHTGIWRMEVRDTGPGVPVKEREKVFEAFYRIGEELRRTTPGTGLGLALVKRTAEAHGGRVEVSDAPEGGACFRMILPMGKGENLP